MPWIAILLVVAVVIAFFVCNIRFAAEKSAAPLPEGGTVEVLVHRSGVDPQVHHLFGLGTMSTVAIAYVRKRGRPWQWAVTVRKQTPVVNYGYGPPLIREVFPDLEVARRRAALLLDELTTGALRLSD